MTQQDLPPLFILPGEAENDAELFEVSPFTIIAKYLDCFDRNGRLVRQVPAYVAEALARRFILVRSEQLNSLDQAFGGRIARQRNRIREDNSNLEIVFHLQGEIERARAEPVATKGAGTPFEVAVERTAERFQMSPENVRRIYRRSGSR